MNWTDRIIPFHLHPLGFIDAFTHFGADLPELLNSAGIDEQALKTAQEKISYQQFIQLIRAGMRLCSQPALGLLISDYFKWYYHGLAGMAIISSSSFNQAGLAFQRYSCLSQPYYTPYRCKPFFYLDNRLRVIIPIEHLITTPALDEEVYRFEVEFRLGMLFRMLRQFGDPHGEAPAAASVELNLAPPDHGHLYREMTCHNIRFNCEYSRLVLPVTVLDMEGDILRKGIYKQTLDYCNHELRKIASPCPNTEQVRMLLVENLPRHTSIGYIAERMDITTRTLARKLKQEHTTFTDILNEVRSEVAIYFLQCTQLSIDDIAECMGFADTANFRQAFRRWTGRSSSEYRKARPAQNPGAGKSSNVIALRQA